MTFPGTALLRMGNGCRDYAGPKVVIPKVVILW